MDRLKIEITVFRSAHAQFVKALEQEKNEFIRDSAIQRFEFTFELFWKVLKLYCEYEGKAPNSPRSAIREAFSIGIIPNDARFLQMLEDRNNTVHTYKQELAEEIFSRLAQYSVLMTDGVNQIEKNLTK